MDKKKEIIINFAYYVLIVAILFGVCKFILSAMSPFVLAFFVATLIQIPVRKIGKEDTRKRKILSIIFVLHNMSCYYF